MGAWGHGTFENDDASDWVWELQDSKDFSVIETALDAVTDGADEYLEAPQCSNALAAAEVVAALNGRPCSSLPGEVLSWLKGKPRPSSPLIAKAPEAVAAVLQSSELRELWAESEHLSAWQAATKDIDVRLT